MFSTIPRDSGYRFGSHQGCNKSLHSGVKSDNPISPDLFGKVILNLNLFMDPDRIYDVAACLWRMVNRKR